MESADNLLGPHKMATIVVGYLNQKYPDRLYSNDDLNVQNVDSVLISDGVELHQGD